MVWAGRAGSWRHAPGWCGSNRRPPRLHPALQRLQNDHAAAAAGTRRPWVRRFGRLGWCCCRRHRQQRPGAGDVGLSPGAGEQAIMPNAAPPMRGFSPPLTPGLGEEGVVILRVLREPCGAAPATPASRLPAVSKNRNDASPQLDYLPVPTVPLPCGEVRCTSPARRTSGRAGRGVRV